MSSPDEEVLVIPCSKAKDVALAGGSGPSILDYLSAETAQHLAIARQRTLTRAHVVGRSTAAWMRYTGHFYASGHDAIVQAILQGRHVLILSGGYGVVRADEAIRSYDRVFHPGDWDGVVSQALVEYARSCAARRIRIFAAGTSAYAKLGRATAWAAAGVGDARLVTPITEGRGGAQVLVPRALGQAFAAYLEGRLVPGWRSSDGLRVEQVPI